MREGTDRRALKAWCSKCHYSVWNTDAVVISGGVAHKNCRAALADGTKRKQHPNFKTVYGLRTNVFDKFARRLNERRRG